MYVDTDRRPSAWLCGELRRVCCALGADQPRAASQMTDGATTEAAVRDLLGEIVRPPYRWVTFVSLLPSQQIVAHADPALPTGIVRYHLPLLTNAGCWSFSAGGWQRLHEGRIYTMQPEIAHGAVNWGPTVRVHLLVDAAAGGLV